MPPALSSKMRAYLAEIYRLIDRQLEPAEYVSTSQLAEILDVSPPAVNRMVNRLGKQGLLHHQPYQGIAITESGAGRGAEAYSQAAGGRSISGASHADELAGGA